MPLTRRTGQLPEANWTMGLREMTEPWKGAVGCFGVAVFFAMTIGIISWQAQEQSPEEWVLRGRAAGVLWERRSGALRLRALPSGRPLAVIAVGSVPAAEPPPPRDRCWHDGGTFCYSWEEDAELHISLEPPPDPDTECYGIRWTPLRPDVVLKDCFSMANISWYGGASPHTLHWPLNGAQSPAQPFVTSDLSKNPAGYGPLLERYFLASTGVTVTVAPDEPLLLSLERDRHFCLEAPAGRAAVPLRYLLCASPDVAAAQRAVGSRLGEQPRALPDTALLGSPLWRYHGPSGSAARIRRGLRALARRLRRHRLQDGVVALGEHSTAVLAAADRAPPERRRRQDSPRAWEPSAIAPLRLCITLSPYGSIASPLFLRSLRDGAASPWLSLRPRFGDSPVPLLSTWKGQPSARLNASSGVALNWYLARARSLRQALGAAFVAVEGAEGDAFLELGVPAPPELAGDRYTQALAAALATLGNGTAISAGARTSHLPLFVQMRPLRADWGRGGLRGLIPTLLHHSLLGYSFLIPDAVGGSLAQDTPGDPELYVRWLQIVTFLPVMAFSTPPWLCCDAWVLNLTRQSIQRHRDFVVPLLLKYSQEWLRSGFPIFRPTWWLSPTDPTAFTIDDEFLIGDEVLVAPITGKGQRSRDIFLPGAGHRWLHPGTARVFDGGTTLSNFSAGLAEVPVFVR
ncbi:SP15 protein, partial [Rhinopomastus cyanomelas]|nr:SP15 protein [Rhinopomastus cyanomelas]